MRALHSNFKLHLESHIHLSTKRAEEDEEGIAGLFSTTLSFHDFPGFQKKKKVFY